MDQGGGYQGIRGEWCSDGNVPQINARPRTKAHPNCLIRKNTTDYITHFFCDFFANSRVTPLRTVA